MGQEETKQVEVKVTTNHKGLDVGTMNLVAATMGADKDKKLSFKKIRNAFLEIDSSVSDDALLDNIEYIKIDDEIYLIGEDAFLNSNIFSKELKRPMKNGVISTDQLDSMEIISFMIESLIGKGKKGDKCCFSVPAAPIDADFDIAFHESTFSSIIKKCGYTPVPVNEALAVIFSECSKSNFSGISISFGSGLTNVCVAFKSIPVLEFAINKGGDYIDQSAAIHFNEFKNKMTSIKEHQDFDLYSTDTNLPKKNKKLAKLLKMKRAAIITYYDELINFTLDEISKKLEDLDVDFPESIPLVVSGGTSMAKGFVKKVTDIIMDKEFPFEISEVRAAKDPLTAVASGCLIKAYK